MIKLFTKSFYANDIIKKNQKIKLYHLNALKPGNGIPIIDYKKIINKKAKRHIKKNELIKLKDLK